MEKLINITVNKKEVIFIDHEGNNLYEMRRVLNYLFPEITIEYTNYDDASMEIECISGTYTMFISHDDMVVRNNLTAEEVKGRLTELCMRIRKWLNSIPTSTATFNPDVDAVMY